jgi:hypothetical protein
MTITTSCLAEQCTLNSENSTNLCPEEMNDKTNQHDDPEKDEKKQGKSGLKAYARYSGLGIQMVVIILISVWGGIKLDRYLQLSYPSWVWRLQSILL